MSDGEGFHVVRGRKSRKTRGNVKMPVSCNKAVDENQTVDLQSFKMRLNNCILEVATSQFFKNCYEKIIAALTLLNQDKAELGHTERSDPCDSNNPGNTAGIGDQNVAYICPSNNDSFSDSTSVLQHKDDKGSALPDQGSSHKDSAISRCGNSHSDCRTPEHFGRHNDLCILQCGNSHNSSILQQENSYKDSTLLQQGNSHKDSTLLQQENSHKDSTLLQQENSHKDSTLLQQENSHKDCTLLQQENIHKNSFIPQQKNSQKGTFTSHKGNSHKDCPASPHLNDHKDSSKDEVIPEDVDHSFITDLGSVSLSEDGQQSIHLLSYGIGNFTSCLIARYQLGFLLALRDKLGSRCTECCVYDPVFSGQEKLLLETYGCQVIPENEEGKRECRAPTIAFLPHCGRALYNNLLWRNVTTAGGQGLSFLVLMGNSFSNILERTPERLLKNTGSYILKLSPYLSEVQLANTFTHKDVFNDMAIHYFLESPLRAALQRFGQDLQEPVYQGDDAEFIRRTLEMETT